MKGFVNLLFENTPLRNQHAELEAAIAQIAATSICGAKPELGME